MDEMKNKFDQILRDKLQNEKFDFREEYWEGASTMIKAEKSGILWKWVSFSLSVVVIGLTLWLSISKNPPSDELALNGQTPEHPVSQQPTDADDHEVTLNSSSEQVIVRSSDQAGVQSNTPPEQGTAEDQVAGESASSMGSTGPNSGVRPSTPSVEDQSYGIGEGAHIQSQSASGSTGSGNTPRTSGNTPAIADQGSDQDNETPNRVAGEQGSGDEHGTGELLKKPWSGDFVIDHRIAHPLFRPMWFDQPINLTVGGLTFLNLKPDNGSNPKSIRNQNQLLVGFELGGQWMLNKSNAEQNTTLVQGDSLFQPTIMTDYKLQSTLYTSAALTLQKGKFGIQVGAAKGSLKESFRVEGSSVQYEYDTTISLVQTSFGPNGDYWLLKEVVDSTGTIGPNPNFENRFKNQIRYIDLPITVFFEMPIPNFQKWSASVGAGMNFRIPTNATVNVISGDGQSIETISGAELSTTRTTQAYVKLNYRPSPTYDFFFKATGMNSSSAFTDRNNFNYSSTAYGLGLTYWIRK